MVRFRGLALFLCLLLGLSCTGGPISDLPFTGGPKPPSQSNGDGTSYSPADAGAAPEPAGDGDTGSGVGGDGDNLQDAGTSLPSVGDAGSAMDGGTEDAGTPGDASAEAQVEGAVDASMADDAG